MLNPNSGGGFETPVKTVVAPRNQKRGPVRGFFQRYLKLLRGGLVFHKMKWSLDHDTLRIETARGTAGDQKSPVLFLVGTRVERVFPRCQLLAVKIQSDRGLHCCRVVHADAPRSTG